MEKPRLELVLTGQEVYFLADVIRHAAIEPGGGKSDERDYYTPLARELLLVLASAYCEVVHLGEGVQDRTISVWVDEEMAWLMREVVRNDDVDSQGHQMGAGLLVALYSLLLAFHTSDLVDITSLEEMYNASGTGSYPSTNQNENSGRDASAFPGTRTSDGPGEAMSGAEDGDYSYD